MRVIELQKRKLDFAEYRRRSAASADYETLVTEDTLVLDGGAPVILYASLPAEITHSVRAACGRLRFDKGHRLTGLVSQSRIFGFNPRSTMRKDFCSTTSMAVEHPAEHETICRFGEHLSSLYRQYFPNVYSTHAQLVEEKILETWHIPRTPFTSGIVNKNNPLKYHFDSGNFSGVLSNMVVLRQGVAGGHLACPEYGIGLAAADSSVVLFDGQKILHGVTPIRRMTPDAYRYSIVYYTLKQMWSCLPIEDEIARARSVRVKRERNRVKGVDPNSLTYSADKPTNTARTPEE
jgi:hypothetical protein